MEQQINLTAVSGLGDDTFLADGSELPLLLTKLSHKMI